MTAAPVSFAAGMAGGEVRVRLHKGLERVELTGFGLRIGRPAGFVSADSPIGMGKARISLKEKNVFQVRWEGGSSAEKIESDRVWVRGQMLRVGATPVPYELEILPNPRKGLDVVARLDLETYLTGVLPAEMPLSWPMAALKAQAVAARS
ncbi:MAG: SpoIID/LytB domain-containing protein [Calothrix sp. SM1_5_4]|nr:SpoIID/LytB domain-containing protein [Calothrix sp. SM1_5_4]